MKLSSALFLVLVLCGLPPCGYASGWIVDKTSGCKVWNPNPKPHETVNWFGKCVDGLANGTGLLKWYEGGKLISTGQGYVKNGRLRGSVTMTHHSGGKYVGEFEDGRPNGTGTLTYPGGKKYTGDFKGGKPDGTGKIIYENGDNYVGEVKNGKANGTGTRTFLAGGKYVGEFRDGKPNGIGTMNHHSGGKYVGEFVNGRPNGNGTKIYPNGGKYSGEVRDGKPNGAGTLIHPDGHKIIGEFRYGKPDGTATVIRSDGRKKVVQFKDGKLIRPDNSKKDNIKEDKNFLDVLSSILGGVAEGYVRASKSHDTAKTRRSVPIPRRHHGFLVSEEVSGMNKICFYEGVEGSSAITIDFLEFCPLWRD